MNITFGIITSGDNQENIEKVIDSIRALNITENHGNQYEIIIVGGQHNEQFLNIHYIAFDETIKKAWITKKKNLITEYAQYENIVYLHDYITFDPAWYIGVLAYEKDNPYWDIQMHNIANKDGTRFRDWVYWNHPDYCYPIMLPDFPLGKHSIKFPPNNIVKLDEKQYMYISGAYWMAKKAFMEKYPLNEYLCWGQGEDLQWSKQVLLIPETKYVFNQKSFVNLLKQKDAVATEV